MTQVGIVQDFIQSNGGAIILILASVVGGLIASVITLLGEFWFLKKKQSQDQLIRLDRSYKQAYVPIYKLAKEVKFSMESFGSVAQGKGITRREFAVLAYELFRNNAIEFIEKLDWRQNDEIIFLPVELEEKCIAIRNKLFDGLSSTVFHNEIVIRRFVDNRRRDFVTLDMRELRTMSKSTRTWPNILSFEQRELIESSPFFDRGYIKDLSADLTYVLDYLKKVFTQ